MQSLTLVIWGACRTLDGPGFEPLISKALELISYYSKESLEGIFCNGWLNGAESQVMCIAFSLVMGDVAQYVWCSAGAPFQASALGWRRGVGSG